MIPFRALPVLLSAVLSLGSVAANAEFHRSQLDSLSDAFWKWRATEQPFTNDDIPRIDLVDGFVRNCKPEAGKGYRHHNTACEEQWRLLDRTGGSCGASIIARPWSCTVI